MASDKNTLSRYFVFTSKNPNNKSEKTLNTKKKLISYEIDQIDSKLPYKTTIKKATFPSSDIRSKFALGVSSSSEDECDIVDAWQEKKKEQIKKIVDKDKAKKMVKKKKELPEPKTSIEDTLIEAHKRKEIESNKQDIGKALEFAARLKAEQKIKQTELELKQNEEEEIKRKMIESNKESVSKIMAYISKVNLDKENKSTETKKEENVIVLDSKTETKVSPKRKVFERGDLTDEEISEDEEANKAKRQVKQKPKRQYEYVAIDENTEIESQIDNITSINKLNEIQIEYMVLRDINYFIDIFSGNCEHSWRHLEFKKYSKKSGNILYSNAALISYTLEQYTSAVRALQSIFCKKDNKCDEYIVKVLLPEALIKICMRIYQCSKDAAEDYLQQNNFKNQFKNKPQGSVIRISNN